MEPNKELEQAIENKFLTPSKFAIEIEKIVAEEEDFNYIDAICYYCETNNIEVESVSKLISKPLKERFDIASGLREMSSEETGNKKNEIMDVNQESVLKISSEFSINKMIHGHTHRPFIHKDENLVRVVLSDWENEVNYATVIDGEISLETF